MQVKWEISAYDGDVLWDGTRASLRSAQFEPRLLIAIDKEYFLLTKYYWSDFGEFCWFRASSGALFVPLPDGELDERFWRVALTEPRQTYYHRIWLLNVLSRSAPPARVRQAFDALLAINPRFAYDKAWSDRKVGRAGDLQTFLASVQTKRDVELWEPLAVLLEVAEPDDDPQIVGMAASALFAIDPDRGKLLICGHLNRWRSKGVQRDMRRVALKEAMHLAKFQCDDPGASPQTSQPLAGEDK